MVKLNDDERAMLAGQLGEPRRLSMEHILEVGRFFDAEDLVEVSQVHLMADTESTGEAGLQYLEMLGTYPEGERRVRVPTVTDPLGCDFAKADRINYPEEFIAQERRLSAAFQSLGILITQTCINYQTILPPVLGEHLAYGDTGSSIYANSVMGARTNFQGGPSALAAALTGRVPRYGFHLDERRRGTNLWELRCRPESLSDWGAAGAIIGRAQGSYWEVPVIVGVDGAPTSDELKQFGAALASFGSTPLFHMVGITPEAPDLASVFDDPPPDATEIARADIDGIYSGYRPGDDKLDVVVFAAPQLSLIEMQTLGLLLRDRVVHPDVTVLAATSPEIKAACDRMGITEMIETSGAVVLEGVCFYQMHAREIGKANGWRRLMSNSAKIVNILGGYGYEPVLGTMEHCIDSAVAGRIA
ncbi:MAG: aconitase X catalytic domain-containing protein [Alphaproteobacteria bacterium]|nr:aconitase X catalytic domain-containing protein [Alphaproteobacteria bacterium]